MKDKRQKIVVIAGPTASGKSALAVEIARRFGGEIVNADSMQVYRGMDVGTAKPSAEDRGNLPHHLFDVVNPDQEFNAAIYRSLALPLLEKIAGRNRLAMVVGGTGLYIKTLLGGLLECPPSDPAYRLALNREWDELGPAELHRRLEKLDPESAGKVHPNDRVRVVRALEIFRLTGKPFSQLIRKHHFQDRPFREFKICLHMDREQLYHRINERSRFMFESGLIRETEGLLKMGYSPDLKPMNSLGYRHVINYLHGIWRLDEAVTQLQVDTRRYAKRQLTWFKADSEMQWFPVEKKERIYRKIESFIDSRSCLETAP